MRTCALLLLALGCTGEDAVTIDEPPPDTDIPTTDSGTTGSDCGEVPCVRPSSDDAEVGWHSVAVAPDGAVWVAWSEVEGPDVLGTWVARSPEPGVLDAPVQVPTAGEPIVGGGEKPHLAVSGDRVALGYTSETVFRHGDAHAMYVQIGELDGATVTFADAQLLDDSTGFIHVLEHARVGFAPDGELWALWKRQEYGVSDLSMWAREDAGFAAELVSEQLSTLHDCSPPDFRFADDGTAMFALRQNIDWLIETVVITAAPGRTVFDGPVQVSDNDWAWNDECPEDGPRIDEAPDGTLASLWIAPTDDGYRAFLSTSADRGTTWTPHAPDHETFLYGEEFPTLAFTSDGALLTTAQDLFGVTRLFRREQVDGPVVEERELKAPDGGELAEVELFVSGEREVLVGIGDDSTLWLLDLSE